MSSQLLISKSFHTSVVRWIFVLSHFRRTINVRSELLNVSRIFGIRAKISQILILNSFDLGGALFLRSSFFFFKIEDERSKLISSKLGTRFKNSQMSISVCFHLMKMNYQLKFHILVALTLTWIGFITHA